MTNETTIRLFDSLRGSLEVFKPLEPGKVKMYVCGPTVYDRGHLGHGRSAVAFDVIRRYFEYLDYEVTFVMNITDIDDKMINRAAERGITVKALTEEITPLYMKDYVALGVKPATVNPYATDYVEEMLEIIEKLEAEDAQRVYVIEGDGVYYDISTFAEYGKLSKQKLDELQAGARVEVKDGKRNHQDFVLWKFAKPGEPQWDSKWGPGRPGWHIECSAMTWKTLGEKFDIHGGGLDLKFPHHECEIAQSEGAFGAGSFAQYWMHNGFITVDKEKMSKSLNNFFTLEEAFKKYHPQVIRMFYLQTHYRAPINYSEETLTAARNALGRFHDFVDWFWGNNTRIMGGIDITNVTYRELKSDVLEKEFVDLMNSDFNVPAALGFISELINYMYKADMAGLLKSYDKDEAKRFLEKVDHVLGVIFSREKEAKGVLQDFHNVLTEDLHNFPDLPEGPDYRYLAILKAHLDLEEGEDLFENAMKNDFNVPQAFSVVFNLKNEYEKQKVSGNLKKKDIVETLQALEKIKSVLELSDEQAQLLEERNQARADKNWQLSDELRDKLEAQGIILEDSPTGTIWKRQL